MSDTVIGICTKNFALLACDETQARSIVVYKHDEDKIMSLDDHKLLACSGGQSDRVQFCEYIQRNLKLYQLKNGVPLGTYAVANFTRQQLHTALRKGPKQVNLVIAGYDGEEEGCSMYYMDYLASMHRMNKAVTGYGSYFVSSTLDAYYRDDLTIDEALKIVDAGISEIRTRLLLNTPNFIVKVVDKDGARVLCRRTALEV